MANIVEVRITAFIPDAWIQFMQTSAVEILYNGNNRGFDYYTENNDHKWKLASHLVVNFNNGSVTHYPGVGPTTERTVDKKTGQILREITDRASSNGIQLNYKTWGPNNEYVDIHVKAAVNIPTFNPSPDIDWEYDIRVYRDGRVKVLGKHDAYPAHEIWKRVDSGSPVSIHQYDPRWTGETVYTGLLKFNQSVDTTV
ncbi:DUF3238 domain-containing protein [Paenibacillus tyrfis]|uniref:DUF3238 domain-containing protein n=1 Tax=Paenibacillus tyrfis TaxID=1501230 RepID=UPI00209E3960|nr:DUF3238 domain-containing protein [Paenibacillus tyrfis]MCP1311361.1 DUF3238 domain-containing protein [Paenibacillus tyrfis]